MYTGKTPSKSCPASGTGKADRQTHTGSNPHPGLLMSRTPSYTALRTHTRTDIHTDPRNTQTQLAHPSKITAYVHRQAGPRTDTFQHRQAEPLTRHPREHTSRQKRARARCPAPAPPPLPLHSARAPRGRRPAPGDTHRADGEDPARRRRRRRAGPAHAEPAAEPPGSHGAASGRRRLGPHPGRSHAEARVRTPQSQACCPQEPRWRGARGRRPASRGPHVQIFPLV